MIWLLGDKLFVAKDLEGPRRANAAVRVEYRCDPSDVRYADVY